VHILVVEHNPERARGVTAVLAAVGHRCEVVDSGGAALARLARPAAPDLVLLEERMSDMTALDFAAAANRMASPSPLVVMGRDDGAARWVEAAGRSVSEFVVTDADGAYLPTLPARVEAVGRRARERDRAGRLADALDSTAAAVFLCDRSGTLEYANAAAARLLGRRPAEAAKGNLAEVFALEGEARLKADLFAAMAAAGEWAGEVSVQREDGEGVPCIVTLSPVRRAGGRIDGLVVTLRDVSDRVAMEEALRGANRRLAEQASRDPLTGLYNRAYFREVLEREVARAVRYGDTLSVLMIDLDDFKRVNDEHGHALGDQVLCEAGRVLSQGLRDGDVLARYGGDEFCVLLPNTPWNMARVVGERLRVVAAERSFGSEAAVRIRVSIGCCDSTKVTESPVSGDGLMRAADRALLDAKRQGGDRVLVCGEGDAVST
jgi:diguanylate cyclase (GGDEF)-like protein/PAS domain S-box-containing protein